MDMLEQESILILLPGSTIFGNTVPLLIHGPGSPTFRERRGMERSDLVWQIKDMLEPVRTKALSRATSMNTIRCVINGMLKRIFLPGEGVVQWPLVCLIKDLLD